MALAKKLTSTTSIVPGSTVIFTLEVTNQGTIPATNVKLTDYIPTGLVLDDANWTASAGKATINTAIPTLAAGATVTRTIQFKVDPSFEGTTIRNKIEISKTGETIVDKDSTPDDEDGNGTENNPVNDKIDGDGKNGGDEDDHDIEDITVVQTFDLALKKSNADPQNTPVSSCGPVTFNITVYNQGTLTAKDIQITDYIPTGMLIDDANWTVSGGKATLNTKIAELKPGQSTTVTIKLKFVDTYNELSAINKAEISEAKNSLNQLDIDSTPDNVDGNVVGETTASIDDKLDGNGKTGGDEDDHDFAKITVISKPTLTLSKTNVKCFEAKDATITAVAAGGTTPYTYKLNDGN